MLKTIRWLPAILAMPLSFVAQQANAPPVMGLHVLSATLNPVSHQIDVQLHNSSNKTVVAYGLETVALDAQGNKVGEFRQEFDFVGPEPNPGAVHFIPAGRTATADYTKPEPPDPRILKFSPESTGKFDEAARKAAALDAMASVQVSVQEVAYEDRSYEGNDPLGGWIFHQRRRKAAAARQALKTTLKVYPATPEERRTAMFGLKVLGFNPPETVTTPQQWETVRNEVERLAGWWAAQSQPQGAAK
jgi:hypothetical protein